MTRNLTDPDGDNVLEWQERVVDIDGDSVSVDLILDQVDGSNASDSNPSWLGFTTTTNTINTDETEVLVDITADTSGLSGGSTYTFKITADDGLATTTRTFQLEVTEPPLYQYGSLIYCDLGGNIRKDNLTTDGDISTLGANISTNTVNADYNIFFKTDGTKLYAVFRDFGASPVITSYTLGTAWDISNLTQQNTFTNIDNPFGVFFKPDGKKMYVVNNDKIEQYALGTAWNITTTSFEESLTVASNIRDLWIGKSGTKLYVSGVDLWEYDLSTSWNVSNATQVNFNDASTADPGFDRIFITDDGKKIYGTDEDDEVIRQYDFGTAWDIKTLTNKKTGTPTDTNLESSDSGIFFAP